MAKSKLKVALDNHKGRNIKLEKQRKKEKEARKRKETNKPTVDIEDVEDVEGDEEEGGVELGEEELQTLIAASSKKEKKAKKEKSNGGKAPKDTKGKANGVAKKVVEEREWETEDEEEEDDDDMPERPALDLSKLEDSDSEGSSEDDIAEDDEDEEEDEDDEEEDIAFSDIESLASEDKADVIPHQRLTINNTSALLAGLKRIQLPYSKLAFSEYQSITSDEPTEIPDVEDDLTREKAFYQQSLAAVNDARARLKKEGISFSRPADYFAEMVKSDEHMGKIKAKLVDEAAGKKAAAEARKQRDLKKFGKQVQVAKLQERAKEKRDTLERINLMKRKRQNADITATNEEDLFDVALDETDKSAPADRRKSADGKPNPKRQKKDAKFGFGGKKRFAKSNDAFSTNDARGFSHKKMKAGGPGGGASKRLGKSRRVKRN
ncbi:eukaryotic rRNA processing protein EBP2-domain-containing protein [Lophiotrema nucula]|uniref:Eukaryotic rRNA processing protein EBP2-domain-containing protein n=1 Tax=Lophiotrema nucula TaxID=690887 RepID=A0A6A5YXI8_9PLEO|nr:eukaryotic rRNA processing protein EBP2-domain-containing protein [Lophiotrema nucula]